MTKQNKENETVDDLVSQLCADHKEIKPLGCALKRSFVLIFSIIAYNLIAIQFDNVRHNIDVLLSNEFFFFELILVLSIGIMATIASSYLMIPDMKRQKWLLTVPVVLLGVFLLWILTSFLGQGYESEYIGINQTCFLDGVIYATFPTLLMILIVRRGASTHRNWQTLMATLSAIPFGWISLRFVCTVDNASHIFIDHVFPFVLIGIGLSMFSRKLFSW